MHAESESGAIPDPVDVDPALAEEVQRQSEELRMLLIGFGFGLTIGLIFLLYVVLGEARLLT